MAALLERLGAVASSLERIRPTIATRAIFDTATDFDSDFDRSDLG
jgi:predicted transcriptional regulator